MNRIQLKDQELNGLTPRYKKIQSDLSNLAHEINQMINRLEPTLLTSQDIDMRLTSALRNLQNCEEKVGILINQINIAGERFEASDRRVVNMSNELIYQFKQVLHQIKNDSSVIAPLNPALIEDKQIIEEMFEAKGQIDSVKLGYIAEIADIKKDEELEAQSRSSGAVSYTDVPINMNTDEEGNNDD